MNNIQVPTRDQVSANNQTTFDNLQKGLGFVPNLYATFAYSETALNDYLAFGGRKSSLSGKEKEIINLVVSQYHNCAYCLGAHTAIGKMNGFTDEEVIEIRSGSASFDSKFQALTDLVQSAIQNRSKPSQSALDNFFAAGYTTENLVDVTTGIGEITVTNYLHGATQIPVDFPAAPALEPALA